MIATLRGLLACGLLALCLTTAAFAQTDVEKTAEQWDSVAVKAEQSVEEADTPTSELDSLRGRIVNYRSEFEAARSLNAERIAALRDQLAALGTAPEGENAEPEAPEVAKTRADINQQLNTLLAPVQIAEREFLRADGLVREIDKIIRERQTERLLRTTPSPLMVRIFVSFTKTSTKTSRLLERTITSLTARTTPPRWWHSRHSRSLSR